MAYWPPQLPKPKVDGYGLAPQPGFARSDMGAGPARQRRRFTAAPTEITLELVMTDDQMAIFEAWYEHRVDSGAGSRCTSRFRFAGPRSAWRRGPARRGLGSSGSVSVQSGVWRRSTKPTGLRGEPAFGHEVILASLAK